MIRVLFFVSMVMFVGEVFAAGFVNPSKAKPQTLGELNSTSDLENKKLQPHPAQQPIERGPGLSTSPVVYGVDSKGRFGVTRIDQSHETTIKWIKEGHITKEHIKRVESGEAVEMNLPSP